MSLLERIEHVRDARAWEGEIPITNRYTAGPAGERFFHEIKDNGRLVGTRCPTCDLLYVPPRLYCEQCFAHLDEWVDVRNCGRVHTFTVVHVGLDGQPLDEPRILAFVRIEDTDGGLVHYLDEVEPEDVCIGMCVEPVFRPKTERKGSILDIAYFRPCQCE